MLLFFHWRERGLAEVSVPRRASDAKRCDFRKIKAHFCMTWCWGWCWGCWCFFQSTSYKFAHGWWHIITHTTDNSVKPIQIWWHCFETCHLWEKNTKKIKCTHIAYIIFYYLHEYEFTWLLWLTITNPFEDISSTCFLVIVLCQLSFSLAFCRPTTKKS